MVNLIVAVLLAPLTILTLSFTLEVLVGVRPLKGIRASTPVRAMVVIAAHDEAAGLATTLEHLKKAIVGDVGILLVADNCEDSTAEIGRQQGVKVIERFDAVHRGKGFALDFAKSHLMQDPPDVVVILDADCRMDESSLSNLISACGASGRPCQAINLQQPPGDASPAVQLSTFAFFVKNVIRQRALQRLAGRTNLLGTGMAFPWPIFAGARLATGSIVEDLKLGQELAQVGHSPILIEDATVWSNAETERNTLMQRTRWEGGFIHNALLVGPPMLLRSLARADPRGSWAAIHAMIPPFALLILMDVAAIVLAAVGCLASGIDPRPVLVLTGSLVAAFIALGAAWRAGGSKFVSLTALCRAPFYVLWKIPMYVGFARHGMPKTWQRTDRD